jgi:hypothetical protein
MDQPALTPRRTAWSLWLLLAGLVAYSAFLWRHTTVQPGGSDSSGYFNAAKLLAHGQVRAAMRAVEGLPSTALPPYAYTPLGFLPDEIAGDLKPSYPVGLSLFLLAGQRLFGAEAGANLVMILHALAGVGLVFALARTAGCQPGPALLAAAVVALSPLTLMHTFQAMSDVPAMMWTTAALWLAWRSPASAWTTLAAGLALGIAVLLRPTNLIATLPLVFVLGASWRRWLWLGLGGLPCVIAVLTFNYMAYHSVLASSYGDVSILFDWRWGGLSLRHYVRWLPVVGTPLVVLALGLPLLFRPAPKPVLVLGSWSLGYLGFYAFYFHTHEWWWYLRFVLPALPALVVAAVLVGQQGIARWLPSRRAAVGLWVVLALGALGSHRYWIKQWGILFVSQQEEVYQLTARWMQRHAPADAVVFCMQTSGALYYHTDHRLLRWDMLERSWPRIRAGLVAAGHPIYGVFFDFEEKPAMEQNVPGRWTKVAQIRRVSVWRLDLDAASP